MEVSGQLHAQTALPHRKKPHVPIGCRFGRCGVQTKISCPVGNRTPAVQPVTRRYTYWAIPVPHCASYITTIVSWESQSQGGAIAQEVRRRVPTATNRVKSQFRLRVICGGQSGAGKGFLRVLWFPLPILVSPTHSIIEAIYYRYWQRLSVR
jgi:hypothetical protein